MPIEYDPFDPKTRADPYPYYAALRRDAPVYWAEGVGGWVISRYDDVRSVLKRAELFSSDAMGTVLIGAQPGTKPEDDPVLMERMASLAKAMPVAALGQSRNLITTDAPDHEALRSVVNRGFTPRRIQAWEGRVREIVADCMGALRERADFDVIRDLAVPVPVVVIAEMLGVETERQDDFKRWSDGIVGGVTGSGHGKDALDSGFATAMGELSHYVLAIAEERRAHPRDDLVSMIVAVQDEGLHNLSPGDVVQFVLLLLVAGNETTTNLIGNAVNALLDHPDQLARVRDDPGLLPGVVEETLRYDPPIQFLFRRATRDVEIGGVVIRENEIVVPLIGSANRDESQFPRPEEFDVTRNTLGHLSFGFGLHFCLGAALARLEARAALEALLPELPLLERLDQEREYIDSFLIRGPRRIELRRIAA